MGYRILYKDPNRSRREAWTFKTYQSKGAAQKEIDTSVAKYKGKKYMNVKPKHFKIIKKSSNSKSIYGMRMKGGIWG